MNYKNFWRLIFCIAICELAGGIGSIFTFPEIGAWYKALIKPGFNPPNWVFGPVWTALFFLLGISLYLVWNKNWKIKNKFGKDIKGWNPWSEKFWQGKWQKENVILVFCLQLFLNVLWSVLFFRMHLPGVAFFEILMLWFAILYTIVNFYRVSKTSAYLLIPYILWVSFAAILNLNIFLLN